MRLYLLLSAGTRIDTLHGVVFQKILRRITTARAGLAILPNVPTVPEFLPVSRSKTSGRRRWDRLCLCSTRRLRPRIGAPRDDGRGTTERRIRRSPCAQARDAERSEGDGHLKACAHRSGRVVSPRI